MTSRAPIRHPRRGRLTHAQQMFLLYGFDEKWADAFVDEADYRETWAQHREHILAGYRHGRRPIAWWVIESGYKYPGYDEERRFLYEHDLLGSEEREEWETQRPDAVAAVSPTEPAGAPEGPLPPPAA